MYGKHSWLVLSAPLLNVGYEGGLLTDAVSKNPYSVLLLDEIEKAHPDIYNTLLQVMDHGTLTDSNGRSSDFRQVVLIMTTNAGTREGLKQTIGIQQGAGASHKRMDAVKDLFSPEFMNRLDSVVLFAELAEAELLSVVRKFVKELADQLSKKNVHLIVDDEALAWLQRKGFDPNYARPLARTIDEFLKPLVDEFVSRRGALWEWTVLEKNALQFNFQASLELEV